MEKKYCLIFDDGDYRVKATKDFGDIKTGQVGGIVSDEHNLSQDGICWIDFDSSVIDDAQVVDNAQVIEGSELTGNTKVYGNAKIISSTIRGCVEIYDDVTISHSVVDDSVKVYGNSLIDYCRLSESVSIGGSTKLHSVDVDGKAHIIDGCVNDTNSIIVISGIPIGGITIYSGFRNGERCVLTNSSVGVKTIPEFCVYLKEMNMDISLSRFLLNCADIVMENATRK